MLSLFFCFTIKNRPYLLTFFNKICLYLHILIIKTKQNENTKT